MPRSPDKPKRPAPAHAFKPGFDPRRANITPEKAADQQGKKLLVPVEGTGMLAAMRHVLANPGYHDSTAEQVIARDLRKNTREFARQFAELTKLEEIAKAQAGRGGVEPGGDGPIHGSPVPTPPPDLGTARCLELIDQLLGETP